MNKITTVLSLAMLGASAPAFAVDLDGAPIDEHTTYAQSLDDSETSEDAVRHRSGKRPAGRPASTARGAPSQSKGTPARPSSTARSTGQRAPAPSTAARPGGPSTQRTASTASTRPSSGPSRSAPPPTTAARPGGPPVAHTSPGATTRTVRPGTPVRPGPVAHARPGTVVHTRPGTVAHTRPGTVVHTRPGTVVHTRPGHVVHSRPVHVHTVRYTHVYPYHGVFVYGPRPVTHVHYVRSGSGPVRVEKQHLPKREIDREHTIALGLKGGSMISGTSDGQLYGDPGLGLVGRYRPAESVALEMALGHHASAYAGARAQTQLAGSVELFAFPWTRVSPYALAGVTWNGASFADEVWNGNGYDAIRTVDSQWGLHGGLGLELGLGKNFALDFEGRYIGWLDERSVGEAPGAIQATAGVMFHFK
jgi:hypothetical protein